MHPSSHLTGEKTKNRIYFFSVDIKKAFDKKLLKNYFLKVLKSNTDYSVFTSDIEIDVKKSQFSIAAN